MVKGKRGKYDGRMRYSVTLNLFQDLLYNGQQCYPGDADLRQHDVSGLSVICRHPELVSVSPVQWIAILSGRC